MSYSLVWFKRDLRWHDHAALWHAAQEAATQGRLACLYIIEPELWRQPDMATQHYLFIRESLRELYAALRQRGGQLHIVCGEATTVLQQIYQQQPFVQVLAHEETGNGWTYQRDLQVAAWCRRQRVSFREFPQFGVVRRLPDRDQWRDLWEQHMARPQFDLPDSLNWQALNLPLQVPEPAALFLQQPDPPARQRGGRQTGLAVLQEFLTQRSASYRGGISSPLKAPSACSRLSPYLAYGCLSLREVVQAARWRLLQLAALAAPDDSQAQRQQAGIKAFISRLYWHCHFIQKLESEPRIEFEHMHRAYQGLRENDWNQAWFERLQAGQTGWPLVDACVAMLNHTGWLNFRMRAMLVSVAAYPLWLHWRPVGLWLAQQFLDYEPGIHWSQLQMQSGTTGINTTRVYNPIKQAQDHDPHGHFVRHWLPALRRVPDSWLFEPWLMADNVLQQAGLQRDREILMPVLDLSSATRAAKQRLHQLRAQPEVRAAKAEIVERHGSRQIKPRRSKPKPAQTATAPAKSERAASSISPKTATNQARSQRPASAPRQQLGFEFD